MTISNALKPIWNEKKYTLEEMMKKVKGCKIDEDKQETVKSALAPSSGIVYGQFDVESVTYQAPEGGHLFTNLLTPKGLFPYVMLYDELLPEAMWHRVLNDNTHAEMKKLPIRIPAWLDYALTAACYKKRDDLKCKTGINHLLETIWRPDAKSTTPIGTSTLTTGLENPSSIIEHGLGLLPSHPLYQKDHLVPPDSIKEEKESFEWKCITGILLENDLLRALHAFDWRMSEYWPHSSLRSIIHNASEDPAYGPRIALIGNNGSGITVNYDDQVGLPGRGVRLL